MEIGKWKRGRGDQRTDSSDQEAGGTIRRIDKDNERELDEEVESEENETKHEEEGAEGDKKGRRIRSGTNCGGTRRVHLPSRRRVLRGSATNRWNREEKCRSRSTSANQEPDPNPNKAWHLAACWAAGIF